MSFPSALSFRQQGMSAEDALLQALKSDTAQGYAYLQGLVDAYQKHATDAVAHVRTFLDVVHHDSVLRFEWLSTGGLKIDVDPDSSLGGQVSRLLGTDVARGLLQEDFKMSFALANCCGGIAGGDPAETVFTAEDQIRWQHSIDC